MRKLQKATTIIRNVMPIENLRQSMFRMIVPYKNQHNAQHYLSEYV